MAYCDSLIARGDKALLKGDYVRSLELETQARHLAEKNHWHHQLLLAINTIGANYYYMNDYGEALNAWAEGYSLAIKHSEPVHEMKMLNNIGTLFTLENPTKAGEYFGKAYNLAKKNNNQKYIGVFAYNLGNIAIKHNEPGKARKYALEAMPYIKKYRSRDLIQVYFTLAESKYLEGKYKQAQKKAEELLSSKEAKAMDFEIPLLHLISKCYLKQGNSGKAKVAATKIFAFNPDVIGKKMAFEQLAEIYAQERNIDSALIFKDSIIGAQKQLNDIKNGRLFENNRVKVEVEEFKKGIAEKEKKLDAERRLLYFIMVIVIAVVSILILIFRQKKLLAEKNRQTVSLELEKEKNANLLLEGEIKEKEANAMLEQERLKNEIEAKNRKLSAKALYLTNRNELIEEVLTSIAKKPKIAKDAALVSQIKDLKYHMKAENEWNSFIAHFEEVNHGFLERLKNRHPSLNQNDIRFVTYIYMNLTIKEIASVLNITPESCRKRKERISAKMDIPENTTIYNYILSI